jgi:hypothetical protein
MTAMYDPMTQFVSCPVAALDIRLDELAAIIAVLIAALIVTGVIITKKGELQ